MILKFDCRILFSLRQFQNFEFFNLPVVKVKKVNIADSQFNQLRLWARCHFGLQTSNSVFGHRLIVDTHALGGLSSAVLLYSFPQNFLRKLIACGKCSSLFWEASTTMQKSCITPLPSCQTYFTNFWLLGILKFLKSDLITLLL